MIIGEKGLLGEMGLLGEIGFARRVTVVCL